jgi:uncharacterized protein with PIN domain
MVERFIVDRMLGRLAKWLRILGYDTIYWRGNDQRALVERGRGRIFLTRTTTFPHGRNFQNIIVVQEDDPKLQLRNVIVTLGLKVDERRIFSRCLLCNQKLKEISKEEVEGRVPDFVFSAYSEFMSCPQCSRIYWQGTHQENMRMKINELLSL